MSMFCYQCQETARGEGCSKRGVCGKDERTSNLQDLLVYSTKGISVVRINGEPADEEVMDAGRFITESLFLTITNANFDPAVFVDRIRAGISLRNIIAEKGGVDRSNLHDSVSWDGADPSTFDTKALSVGVLATEDPDVRSLRELTIYGLKGIAAYADHARRLGYEERELYEFMMKALAKTTADLSVTELTNLVLETGEYGVKAMALLDEANTETYGNPELSTVPIGVRDNPGILISGHDLKDMEELLKQTDGTGVDVYTHGEMLPANYYPAFKKYPHLAGNYGGSWWHQGKEFDAFNGPIVMTTNCITPVKDSYRDRIYTTNTVGYPGVTHIPDHPKGSEGNTKDFSAVIAQAQSCDPPRELERGEIVGGFAHSQLTALADTIVDAVKTGKIRRFVVMAGCDGRQGSREYFTEVAEGLPEDTVILTAGCAKYRYNKLDLGDIDGIPRVLDAGQCNDSYSLAVIALKLKEIFELEDVNDLPISFDIAWYEQKAVIVLLALLHLGFKGIRLGPTLPAFLSENVANVLVEKFDLRPIGDAKEDVVAMLSEI